MIHELKFTVALISAMMLLRMFMLTIEHKVLLLIGLFTATVGAMFGYYMEIDFKIGLVIVIGLTWVMFELLHMESQYH